jgi:hypothetical protein
MLLELLTLNNNCSKVLLNIKLGFLDQTTLKTLTTCRLLKTFLVVFAHLRTLRCASSSSHLVNLEIWSIRLNKRSFNKMLKLPSVTQSSHLRLSYTMFL